MAFESFAQQFAALGGRRIFGVPGGGPSLELITQIENNGGSFIATGHEDAALESRVRARGAADTSHFRLWRRMVRQFLTHHHACVSNALAGRVFDIAT